MIQTTTSAGIAQNPVLSDGLSLEGNKLIALFDGATINTTKYKDVHFYEHLKPFKDGSGRYSGICNGITCAVNDLCGDFLDVDALKFHKKWDWLMPIIEEIERLGVSVTIRSNFVSLNGWIANNQNTTTKYEWNGGCTNDSKIVSAWYGVVEFIKWYNQQSVSEGIR